MWPIHITDFPQSKRQNQIGLEKSPRLLADSPRRKRQLAAPLGNPTSPPP
jgi:hypothetical protein